MSCSRNTRERSLLPSAPHREGKGSFYCMRGGVEGLDDSGKKRKFQGHQTRDREKGINRLRSRDKGMTGFLEMKHELIKFVSDVQRQREEYQLDRISDLSDIAS